MRLDWPHLIVWVLSGESGGGSIVSSWLPVIVGVIGVSGTLLGVALGGIGSYFIKKTELSHQIKQDSRKLRIARLEELHERLLSFPSITEAMISGFMYIRKTGKPTRKDVDEIFSASSLSLAKIESLLKIYAAELDFNALERCTGRLIQEGTDYLGHTGDDVSRIQNAQTAIGVKCRELQEAVKIKILNEISS